MGTYLFFASGPRPNDRASRPRTIPIAAQLRKSSRTFVQSGFNEVALTPAIRATLCHATSQNPPDSQNDSSSIQLLKERPVHWKPHRVIHSTATFCPISDNSGQRWILACGGLSATDRG